MVKQVKTAAPPIIHQVYRVLLWVIESTDCMSLEATDFSAMDFLNHFWSNAELVNSKALPQES
jgi:hypothetical protein